ncbi:MAG: hypothetical protein R3B47_13420 [Bacteroidia bacterium]
MPALPRPVDGMSVPMSLISEVYVDGKKVDSWGSRPMNESDRSGWEKMTDAFESITRKAQQEYWLMPGSVLPKKVTFKLWGKR